MIAPSTLGFLLALCLIVQAFFVAAEVALAACDRNQLRARGEGGDDRARRAERMLAVPQVTRATTLVGASLAALIAVLLVGIELSAAGKTPLWSPLVVVPPLLVLGHLMPKAIA